MSPQASASVPVLQSARLTLRGHGVEDFPAMMTMWADPEVTRFIGGRPSSREEVWARLLRYAGHWSLLGYGYWAILETATGRFAGEAGFADFRRDIEPSLDGVPEAGWVLAPWAQGHGFGTEAMREVLAWGERHFGTARSICLINPANLRSIRMAERCGYRPSAHLAYKGERTTLFRRDAPG
ncbi:GNAT family N-acetyltransferase [Labrys wisconsinensis]|uniref:RimJ/RimL family protein N-acetyltransferase n=1 Tax=Labrys wisconsinensis TaxID=425677 RepID=A0ABU0J382_9HYPH|nr:GNAT family N-acetyltransferase [Labrys wisconsinensis]MDQ0468717.1 RimJ/RimL family protein N-acetyltransferase [Labrys wisconsinensis]